MKVQKGSTKSILQNKHYLNIMFSSDILSHVLPENMECFYLLHEIYSPI